MATGQEKVVQRLQSEDFLTVMRSFLSMMQSSLGPNGGIKVLVSSGGSSVASSSSIRLLNNYIFSHPMCTFISQVMKSQTAVFGDHGLYIGVITCSLLEKILKQDIMTQSTARELIQNLSYQVLSLLNSDSVQLSLDFSTVKQLLPVVRTILSSKPACGLSRKNLEKLSVQIVKVFLNAVNDDFGDVVIVSTGFCEGIRIISGVSYQVDIEEEHIQNLLADMTENCNGNLPLLLFNIMLIQTESKRRDEEDIIIENKYDVVKDATIVLEEAVKSGVKIVACQKVVDDSLRLFLQRNEILLLDRMGTELCEAVEKLSGAKPVSDLKKMSHDILLSHVGIVDSAKLLRHGDKSYVSLERNNSNVATLLVPSPSEEAFAELKVVTRQALSALRQVTCRPVVLPGAGCLEAWLAACLHKQDSSCNFMASAQLHNVDRLCTSFTLVCEEGYTWK